MDTIIAALRANEGKLSILPVNGNIDLWIERRKLTVEVAIHERDTDNLRVLGEYRRLGWARNAINRVIEGLKPAAHPDVAQAEVGVSDAHEPAPTESAANCGSIWTSIPVAVKQVATFTRFGTAVTVEVLPSEENQHNIVVHWKEQTLKYSFEGERAAKMEGRKIAEIILDGMTV